LETTLYNKIEVVGDWEYHTEIESQYRSNPDFVEKAYSEKPVNELIRKGHAAILSHMALDDENDMYFYRYEFRIVRQKQNDPLNGGENES